MAKPSEPPFPLTDRERRILDAVKRWRKVDPATGRTADVGQMGHGMPEKAFAAIRLACSMPTTYAEAAAELDMWEAMIRERKVECRAHALDPAVWVWVRYVEEALLSDLPALTLEEVMDRARRIERSCDAMYRIKDYLIGLVRDLDALAPQLKASVNVADPPLDAALKADPNLSDREIARRVGVSPPTVGKARRRLGLTMETGSVKRGSQMFTMKQRGAMVD